MIIFQPVVKFPESSVRSFECREVFTDHGNAVSHGIQVSNKIEIENSIISVNRFILDDEQIQANSTANGSGEGNELPGPPLHP